jgi:hypothetical protein
MEVSSVPPWVAWKVYAKAGLKEKWKAGNLAGGKEQNLAG